MQSVRLSVIKNGKARGRSPKAPLRPSAAVLAAVALALTLLSMLHRRLDEAVSTRRPDINPDPCSFIVRHAMAAARTLAALLSVPARTLPPPASRELPPPPLRCGNACTAHPCVRGNGRTAPPSPCTPAAARHAATLREHVRDRGPRYGNMCDASRCAAVTSEPARPSSPLSMRHV